MVRTAKGNRWIVALACAACALLCAGLALAHDESWKVPDAAKKLKNPVAATPDTIASGHAIYTDKCQKCHGEKGLGDGPEAEMYDPQPSNLADAHMMSEMTDGEIFYKITEGRKPMPSFKKDLSDEQRWQLVDFVRTLAPQGSHGGH